LQPVLGQQQQKDQQHQQGYTLTDAAAADAMPAWQMHQPWAQVWLSNAICVPVRVVQGSTLLLCIEQENDF
jgi:hypothetical protein